MNCGSHSNEDILKNNQKQNELILGNKSKQNDNQLQLKYQQEVKSTFANYAKDMMTYHDKIFGQNTQNKLGTFFEKKKQQKRQRMKTAIQANQKFLNVVIQSSENTQKQFIPDETTLCHNIPKIKTTLKQFFRQWCAESPQIKQYIFLRQTAQKYLNKRDKILVPGCGLGRLALQLVEAGFDTQGNQVTYFMLYGSNFILNCVDKKEEFQIYPFIHSFNNNENEQNMFRPVRIPDKLATQVVSQQIDFSMAAGQFTQIYKDFPQHFNGIITCFFIDTANNVFSYINTIFSCLKKNGIWINYGPLLYHFRQMLSQISVQLIWQQIKSYAQSKGFSLIQQSYRPSTYCHDPLASYTHVYDASFSVWRKLKQ